MHFLLNSDTKEERNALMERVYPKLKIFCQKLGYEFQVNSDLNNICTLVTFPVCVRQLDGFILL